jgi:hypothetical protein
MYRQWVGAALLSGLALALTSGTLPAQQRQSSPGQAPALETDPNLDADDQLAPSQIRQPMPAAVAEPTGGGRKHTSARGAEAAAEPDRPTKPSRSANAREVVCSGVFGPDSSHVKLATAFQAKNVEFTQVDGGSGKKVMASVLFGKDAARRLEVWWSKPASRSDTHLIVINGQSGWTSPGAVRLGLSLPDLERLNGKPFTLSGFDANNVATLSNWNGGELATLPGGCKLGISLRPAATASASAVRALPADRAFTSADAGLRAVNPAVSEILVAY